MRRLLIRAIIALLPALAAPALAGEAAGGAYAIAMHGAPALSEDFERLPYTSPDAIPGGRLRLGALGAFDSLNPYNVKSLSTAEGLIGNVFQSLMYRSADEPFTLYGLIAERIETDEARDQVTFHLDPRAHFSDGAPLTAEDALFSFNLLRDKGRPQQRAAYALVKSAATPDAHTIAFDLSGAHDRELPLTLALMPVLSRAHTDVARFAEPTLAPPVGSGPYRVVEVRPGQGLKLKRDPGYWGRDLPLMRGLYNFDEIDIDYYRDAGSMFEAFKAGLIDFRFEDDATRWLTAYDFPALREGRVIRASVRDGLPKGVLGFAFNTRRAPFANIAVREALASLIDFEWINANLYGGAYRRSVGFFDDSELSSVGRPADAAERALLSPFPGAVSAAALQGTERPAVSDGSGRDRALAHQALADLARAGFALKGGQLVDAGGRPLAFEILVKNREEERLALAYQRSLTRVGVAARVRRVDAAQFQRRRERFDFDMMMGAWIASPSPGAEQRGRWGSSSAAVEGAYNLSGVHSPAIDAVIDALLAARSKEDFVAAARALDRLIISGFYIVPLFYAPEQWIAYSAKLGAPQRTPLFGVHLDAWWFRGP